MDEDLQKTMDHLKKTRPNLRKYVGRVAFIIMIIIAFYVSGWLLFLQPIIGCVYAAVAGTLIWTRVVATIIKFFVACYVFFMFMVAGEVMARVFDTLINLDDIEEDLNETKFVLK